MAQQETRKTRKPRSVQRLVNTGVGFTPTFHVPVADVLSGEQVLRCKAMQPVSILEIRRVDPNNVKDMKIAPHDNWIVRAKEENMVIGESDEKTQTKKQNNNNNNSNNSNSNDNNNNNNNNSNTHDKSDCETESGLKDFMSLSRRYGGPLLHSFLIDLYYTGATDDACAIWDDILAARSDWVYRDTPYCPSVCRLRYPNKEQKDIPIVCLFAIEDRITCYDFEICDYRNCRVIHLNWRAPGKLNAAAQCIRGSDGFVAQSRLDVLSKLPNFDTARPYSTWFQPGSHNLVSALGWKVMHDRVDREKQVFFVYVTLCDFMLLYVTLCYFMLLYVTLYITLCYFFVLYSASDAFNSTECEFTTDSNINSANKCEPTMCQ